jgi:hypothetical protein
MQMLWCWRCRADMPMLDDIEYAEALRLYGAGFKARPLNASRQERFKELLAFYERTTGMKETKPNAIMHHQLSLYGPPCRHCGKPLRTPRAKLCGSCMTPVV